jgi:hypothetical protein
MERNDAIDRGPLGALFEKGLEATDKTAEGENAGQAADDVTRDLQDKRPGTTDPSLQEEDVDSAPGSR